MSHCHDSYLYVQLFAECTPDPIASNVNSTHRVVLDNHRGLDLFDVTVTVTLPPPSDNALALGPGGGPWTHQLGSVRKRGSAGAGVKVINLARQPAPFTAEVHTTATWTVSASQPLANGVPAPVESLDCHCRPGVS
ncbi:hypothetical protein ACFY36_05835 [Actinoplanes sp. NPDC000266]